MKNPKYYHPQTDFYRKYKLDPPESISHGTEEAIRDKMEKLQPTTWRQEGNKLIGKTPQGELVNFIPTNYLLQGTDDDGLPILKEIDL